MNFRLIKKFSIIALVAVLMAVIMPTSSVLHVVRAARVLPTYVSEVIIVKEGDLQAAEEDGYKIVQNKSKESEPLYNGIENGTSSTYLAYKTTRVASEALTDIRLMNMKGGYSFSEYEKYLSEMKTNAEKLASSMWPAIVEFRTNFNADLPWAKFAYDILNVYTYDDVLEDGKPIRLGKLLLDDTLVSNDECDIIKTLFLESNFNVLNAIYDALSVACSKDLNGDSFIDRLNTVDVDKDATELNDIVYSMESDVADIRESVSYYRTSSHLEFDTEEERNEFLSSLAEEDSIKGTNNAKKWMKGYDAYRLLSNIPYSGFDLTNCRTLLDFINRIDYPVYEWYPLVASFSEGTRAVLFLGLDGIVKNALLDSEHYYDALNEVEEDSVGKKMVEEGISVFYNVDREIYKDGMVAMTNSALWGNAKGDDSWKDAQAQREKDNADALKEKATFLYVAYGFAGAAVIGGIVMASVFRTAFRTPVGLIQISKELLDVSGSSVGNNIGKSITQATQITARSAFIAATVVVVVAVIALIVTLVLYFLEKTESPLVYEEYDEIPSMLCYYRNVYKAGTTTIDKDTQKYVYYKVAENPYGVEENSLFGENAKNKELPQNKKPAQDIYNWELRGNRQWVCIYTTKDDRAGFPIKASSLYIDGNQKVSNETTASGFDSDSGFDLSSFYNVSISTNPTLNEGQKKELKLSSKYLHFVMDTTTTSNTASSGSTKTASAINNGAVWGMAIIGLGTGFLLGFLINKKRKKI